MVELSTYIPYLLAILASAVFIIFIWFAYNKDLGEKLDNGEVRKAIAITFTLIYVFLLVLYYYQIFLPASTGSLSGTSNYTLNEPFNISPQSVPTNFSNQNLLINLTAQTLDVPIVAITDIFKNFLYVYLVIIAFYFSSRSFEKYTETGRIRELRQSNSMEIARTRLARGDIMEDEFNKIQTKLLEADLSKRKENLESIKESLDKKEYPAAIDKIDVEINSIDDILKPKSD